MKAGENLESQCPSMLLCIDTMYSLSHYVLTFERPGGRDSEKSVCSELTAQM